jgi:DNA-binding NarL/FixJ family response regulator
MEGTGSIEWLPRSGAGIIDRIHASAPDLILSDFKMPGCNGATVARMAKKASPTTPIVVLTAVSDSAVEAILLKLGVKLILSKPIKGTALLGAIESTLKAFPPSH